LKLVAGTKNVISGNVVISSRLYFSLCHRKATWVHDVHEEAQCKWTNARMDAWVENCRVANVCVSASV